MKTRISLLVGVLICASAFTLIGSRTKAQILGGQELPRKDYTLLETRTNLLATGSIALDGPGPVSMTFSTAELATNRALLKLGRTGGAMVSLEIFEACTVVIKPTGTNAWIHSVITNGTLHFSVERQTQDGALEIEVTTQGRPYFVLTADEARFMRSMQEEIP